MSRADVIESMKDYFRSRYDTVDGAVTEHEWARARDLVRDKFATREWLERVP
jgi:lipoate-protein ligase A